MYYVYIMYTLSIHQYLYYCYYQANAEHCGVSPCGLPLSTDLRHNLCTNKLSTKSCEFAQQISMYYELEQAPECMTHTDTHKSSTNSLVCGAQTWFTI